MAAAPPLLESPLAELGDDELMARLDAGYVEDSLAEIERRYREPIHRFVRTMVQDAHLAQDVTQEVFERVFLKSHLYVPKSCFRGWLFEVARNQSLSTLRARRRTPRPFSSFGDDEEAPGALFEDLTGRRDQPVLEEQELMAAFARAVANLPEHYRTPFELCVVHGAQYADAARQLGLPTGTVAIRIMRARKRLYQALTPHLDRLRRPPACLQPTP